MLVMSSVTWGGTEQVCIDYARLLLDRGHGVIMCLHPRSRVPEVAEDRGLEGAKMMPDRVAAGGCGHLNPLKLVRCRRFVSRNRPDVIIVFNHKVLRLFLAVTRGRFPVVAWCGVRQLKHGTRQWDRAFSADALIGITTAMVDRFRRNQADRNSSQRPVHHVPNTLSIPLSLSEPTVRPTDSPVTIGALGRMDPVKGFHVLLRAVGRLKRDGVPFRLVLGGDGSERQALEQLSEQLGLAGHVDFPGWVTDREGFFSRIDVFCLPSFSETFGLVVTEAMARGCPTIVSDVEGPLSIVDDGVTGLVAERGEPDAWAKALRRLIEDPRLAARLASAAKDAVQHRFCAKVVGDLLETTLGSVVAGYRKSRC